MKYYIKSNSGSSVEVPKDVYDSYTEGRNAVKTLKGLREPNVMVSQPRAAGKQSIKVINEFKRVLADGMTMGLVKPWGSLDSAAMFAATVRYCEYLRFYRHDDDLKIVKHFYKYALSRKARGLMMTEEKFDECLRDYVRGS